MVSVLGQGAFGITYRARDATLGRDVAIKEYLPTALALREGGTTVLPRSTELIDEFLWGRERFLDEARTLVKLEDVPAVVRVIDFLEANGTAYMVMALARGETLDVRIRRDGPLPPPGVERLLYPLLDGLEQVHEVGFLHRDIKPANIVLDGRGSPTLIDFGAARAAMAGRSTAMTAIFTPGYAAAEQFTAARQGPWTDIYGLSATLYHAITGRTPPSAFDRMLDDIYEPLAAIRPQGVPAALLGGIDAGLAVRAQNRPQTISDWRGLLSGAVTVSMPDQQATVVMAPPGVPASAKPTGAAGGRRRRALRGAAAAIAIAALGGAAYVTVAPRGPAIQALKAEELEQLLAERRAADAAAAEKKRLEDEAQRNAEAEAEAKRQADVDLEMARRDRQKAEQELATLKAEMEARRQVEAASQQQLAAAAARRAAEAEAQLKAEAEMAALRAAETDAQTKAAAEAENKRQADEALTRAQAERQKADQEAAARREAEDAAAAKQKAESEAKAKGEAEAMAKAEAAAVAQRQKAESEAKAKAEAEAKAKAEAAAVAQKQKAESDAAAAVASIAEKKATEAAEAGLRLAPTDRERIQVALTSLGFDTRGSDGIFGPRSRDTIAAWQKARNLPSTGFLNGSQQQALLREAAPAVQKSDDERKKVEDEKKKVEDEKRKAEEDAKAALPPAGPPAPGDGAKVPPAVPDPPSAALDGALREPPAERTVGQFDGRWVGQSIQCFPRANFGFSGANIKDNRWTGNWAISGIPLPCTVEIKPDGSFANSKCSSPTSGRITGNKLEARINLALYAAKYYCDVVALRQ